VRRPSPASLMALRPLYLGTLADVQQGDEWAYVNTGLPVWNRFVPRQSPGQSQVQVMIARPGGDGGADERPPPSDT